MGKNVPIKIDKRDHDRVLLTETLPYETPIIFSSSGLYEHIKRGNRSPIHQTIISSLITGDLPLKGTSSTVPLHYKVRKNSMDFRRISLMHPRAQWKVREFYKEFESLIIHYCGLSPASIRSPIKVASSYFRKGSWENMAQYKEGKVNLIEMEEVAKHSPSFFTYNGYDRLYKFYESEDFFELEKSYCSFWNLDVAKCFDSIYTHCLSWAIKSKSFTKDNVTTESTFGQHFDFLMRFSNHNETNGILIGPEVSRIFAELIFQRIDVNVISRLEKRKIRYGESYCFRRYVDDVMIFSKSADISKTVYTAYVDALLDCNLHHNPAKSSKIDRPFATPKSRLLHAANREVNDFLAKFLRDSESGKTLEPLPIRSRWNLVRSFTATIRSLCSYNEVAYDEVATFLVAVFCERIKKIIQVESSGVASELKASYADALVVILDVMYFLYDTAPSVSSSYKLCTAIILVNRFAALHLPERRDSIADRIYQLSVSHMSEERFSHASDVSGFVPLESLNLLLALKELGSNYELPERMVESLFPDSRRLTYFHITCGLFYAGSSSRYTSLVSRLIDAAKMELHDLRDLPSSASKAYLFLDMLTCPYVPDKHKRTWVRGLYSAVSKGAPSRADLGGYLTDVRDVWNISWDGVDLLNQLEKKELKQSY